MTKKKKQQSIVSEPDLEPIHEAINNRLEEIHSSEAVIADVQHKQSAAGIDPPSESEAIKPLKQKRKKVEEQAAITYNEFKTDFMDAWKRHGISDGNTITSYTSNVFDETGLYTIGVNKNNQPYLFLFDHGKSAMMVFTPASLQQLQWHIDDVLVEVGLTAIGVKSANGHLFKSEPKRK